MLHSSEELINVWLTAFSMFEAITVLNCNLTEHNRAADCTATAFLTFILLSFFFLYRPNLFSPSLSFDLFFRSPHLPASTHTILNTKWEMTPTRSSTNHDASAKVDGLIIILSIFLCIIHSQRITVLWSMLQHHTIFCKQVCNLST